MNYGAGVDSTAVLVEFVSRPIRPDVILFADTGSEKPETYEYLSLFSAWLVERSFPAVTVVRRYGTDGQYGLKSRSSKTGEGYTTIEENCLQNQTLPSLAFGMKSCSLKWKAEPMDKYLSKHPLAVATWAAGEKPMKAIGYDCSPTDERRAHGRTEDERFRYWYPLRSWGWDREACERRIIRAGLPVPLKSACFFCPASKPWEVRQLAENHPDLLRRALELERGAQPNLGSVEGLWRKATKSRPGSWSEFVEREGLLRASVA